jgi:uncharacterized membrane protein YeaQ/YmgE (transglycosylase-associated protein family)
MLFLNEVVLVVLLIGLLVGWAAGNLIQVSGLGIAGDLMVGIVGAFIGHYNIHLGHGMFSLVVNATIGAIVLLLVFGLVTFMRGWAFRSDEVSRGFERAWRTPS